MSVNRKGKLPHRWNIADTITSIRILASAALLFLPLYSVWFYVIYTITGLSDALDGVTARGTGTASEFGARLDSIADLLFYSVMLYRIFPDLWRTMPKSIWYAVGAILMARISAYAVAAIKYHRFAALHTWLNKLTGGAVFILPYMLAISSGVVYAWALCALAFIASVEELAIHISGKAYSTGKKSFFADQNREA